MICLLICLAALGLSCSTQDLHCITWALWLQLMDSLVVACGLSSFCAQTRLLRGMWGSYFPIQGLNPRPLHLEVDSHPLGCQGSA